MKEPSQMFRECYEENAAFLSENPNLYGDPSAMVLATASADGRTSARMVLLKEFDNDDFVFFTNYNSLKSLQLSSNGRAALLFWWPHLQRQIRIEGRVLRTLPEESDEYFMTRPPESRLGAWASDQSNEIKSINLVMRRMDRYRQKFGDEIPRPRHWGGYRLTAERYEFWQEGEHRLHNRLVYEKNYAGWETMLLAP